MTILKFRNGLRRFMMESRLTATEKDVARKHKMCYTQKHDRTVAQAHAKRCKTEADKRTERLQE